ncbi:MAG: hypothetical protein M1830_004758 [Pleopsidium flavum]|nr:MAG: hypothetical protein M1830_004758 [Pleopsidium flavum]
MAATPSTQRRVNSFRALDSICAARKPSHIAAGFFHGFAGGPRHFTTTLRAEHAALRATNPGEEQETNRMLLHRRDITFIDKEGNSHTLRAADDESLLDIAQANNLEMEGACGGTCACSTCHVIVTSPFMYRAIPEPMDNENDMLDLAFGITETSRLGCQIKMNKALKGLVVKLPGTVQNVQAST